MKPVPLANQQPFDGVCWLHGKRLFRSRKAARRAARRLHDSGLQAYRCHVVPGHWHYGHLPRDVKRGLVTKAEYYAALAYTHRDQENRSMTQNPIDAIRAAAATVAELVRGRPTSILMSTANAAALKAGTLTLPAEVLAAVKRYATGPAWMGIDIHIDESCEQPRLDWARCPACHPDQPDWAVPEHCPAHQDGER